MKRIISAMLAVLICVLTLGGCEKTPTGQESSSGSSFAESGEASVSDEVESGESEDSEQEESFDYTGWQEFTEGTACQFPEISSYGGYFVNCDDVNYSGTVSFKLPPDFTIGYDVYGAGFHMSKRFDFYPRSVHVFEKSEEESMRELFLELHPEAILFPELKLCICPSDFSEPWYDYPVEKEGRGDPDWMSAYGYGCYLQTDYGAFTFNVREYAAFDENYDMTEAIEFIKQLAGTISTSVVKHDSEKP